MPITLFEDPAGALHARQTFSSPTVYLDHWAVRHFARPGPDRTRFVHALRRMEGTLLLSSFNLLEFAAPEAVASAEEADAFFNELLPYVYFTSFDFQILQSRELEEPDNRRRFWPPPDLERLEIFVRRQSDLGALQMHGFVALAHQGREQLNPVKAEFVDLLRQTVQLFRTNPHLLDGARRVGPVDARPRTANIFGELLRGINLDAAARLTDNDAVDLMHAAMPINCCDFVLLDGAWEARVNTMKARIVATGLEFPLGSCFSRRNEGIARFLYELEQFAGPDTAVP